MKDNKQTYDLDFITKQLWKVFYEKKDLQWFRSKRVGTWGLETQRGVSNKKKMWAQVLRKSGCDHKNSSFFQKNNWWSSFNPI